jgi:aldehyde dehydrogenase family 7 protein A1
VAVYFWNLALSLICGNTNLWKPHESVSLTAVAVTKIVSKVLDECQIDGAIASMICGNGKTIGQIMVADKDFELISFTGSTAVGREVSSNVGQR